VKRVENTTTTSRKKEKEKKATETKEKNKTSFKFQHAILLYFSCASLTSYDKKGMFSLGSVCSVACKEKAGEFVQES